MTPEEQEKSEALYRSVNEQLERQNNILAAQFELAKKTAEAQGINISSLNKSKTAYDGLYGSTTKQTAAGEANAHGLAVMNQAMAQFDKAAISGTAATFAFGKALLSTEKSFAKYNDVLKNAGDAAWEASKNFGLLGMATGALIKGVTMAAQAATKQADNTLKATDDLSKMGSAGAFSAKEVLKMGHDAGLTSKNLEVFTKATKTLGTATISLGSTAGEGIAEFAKMTAVSKEQRMAFQRLGISQEELIQSQADFVSMQKASGVQITARMKQDEGLKKASLEYTKNLLELAAITGEDVEGAKKLKLEAETELETKIQTNMMQQRINALQKEGTPQAEAQAELLKKELESRRGMLEVATSTKDAEIKSATASFLATGAITEQSVVLKRLIPNIEEFGERVKRGENVAVDFAKALADGVDANVRNVGTAGMLDKAVAKTFGMTDQMLTYSAQKRDVDLKAAKDAAGKLIGAPEKGETGDKTAKDPAQIARNELTELEIKAQVELDKLLATVNPLITGFDKTTTAATLLAGAAGLAAIALTAMAGLSALKDLKGLASKGGPAGKMPGGGAPTAPAPTSPTKPSGMSVDEKAKYDNLRKEGVPAAEAKRQAGGFSSLVSAENKITPPKPVTPPIPVGAATETLAKEAGALGKMGGALSTASKFAGPAAGAVSVLTGGYTAIQGSKAVDEKVKKGEITKDEGTVQKSEAVGKGAGGAVVGLGGAALGAAIGTMIFPVVGTAIGAAFGGWLGSKGGEMVGENVGTIVGKSIIEKPKVDASGRATAATDPRVVGTQQNPANVKTTEPTSTKPATATNDPRLKNAGAESPENVAKGIADMAKENAMRASVSNAESLKSNKEFVSLEINITALNKTLMSTNTALANLTATISTNKPTTFKTSESKPIFDTKPVQVKLTTEPKPVDTIPKLVDATPKPIDNTIKPAPVKPMTDINDMGAAAIYSKLVGSIQLATAKPTNTTPSVSIADIQANMAKGMNQPEAQKAAEAKAEREAKAKFDTSTRATSATDSKLVGVSTNLDMENPVVIARQMKEDAQKTIEQRIIDTQKITKASDSQEVSMTTLNRTLLSTNTALKDLTGSITNITNPTTTPDSNANKPVTGGGISIPAGILASFKSALGGTSGGASGASTVKSTGAPTSEPTASTMAMTSEGKKTAKPPSQPPEEGGPGSATKSVDLAKIMKFGTNSGTQQNFEALDSTFKDAVVAAATEYNSVTGNKLQVNSAKRDPADQQRLWDESVAAGRTGISPTGMPIGKPGRSLHEKGEAVDIQNYKDPDAVAAMNKQGLTQKVPGDPVHFQALEGGILNGPKSGYPVEGTMHGREAIIPLNPDSIITKLLTTSEAQVKQEMNNNVTTNTQSSDNTSQIMADLYSMMEEKFDTMIDILEDGNDHTEKLVRFSAV